VPHTEPFAKPIPGSPARDRPPITRCCERPWVISATTCRSACSGFPGKAALPCRCGRWRAEARCDIRVAGDVYGKRLRAGSKWETAGKRPAARGNIEGRRRAYLTNTGLRPHGRRCACCGSRNVAVARRTARSSSADMPRPTACTAGLGDNGFPGGSQVLRMSCDESRGAGEPVRARAASCATPQP
jgi:hypothetical protein